MIDENDIGEAIGERVKSVDSVPHLLAENFNKPTSMTRPYLVFEVRPTGTGTGGKKISGGITQAGFAQVTIVADIGEFAEYSNDMAAKIAAAFPYELSIPCGDGVLTVTEHTTPGPGFRDGSDWRKIVQIDYIAI